MLENLACLQLKAFAAKARAVRKARDRILTRVRDDSLAEQKPARGAHDPAAELGLAVVPEDDPNRKALEAEISAMSDAVRRELWAATLIGRGDYGVKDWDRALGEAQRLTEVGPDLFLGVADLDDHLMKTVYEVERM